MSTTSDVPQSKITNHRKQFVSENNRTLIIKMFFLNVEHDRFTEYMFYSNLKKVRNNVKGAKFN